MECIFTTGNVLDYLRYKSIQDTKDLGADTILREETDEIPDDGADSERANIGEQDKLVHALTATNGIIKAFVRGAKNIKNQKCAATSLLTYSRLTVYKGRESYIIGDAIPERIFQNLGEML